MIVVDVRSFGICMVFEVSRWICCVWTVRYQAPCLHERLQGQTAWEIPKDKKKQADDTDLDTEPSGLFM